MDIFAWFVSHWDEIKSFGNSNFTTAIIGSLFGAFAGAYGAQVITEKVKIRESTLKEIRHTNRAMALALGLCNTMLSVKSQFVKGLYEEFLAQLAEYEDFQTKLHLGEIKDNTVYEARFNLKVFLMPIPPVDALQKVVFDELSVSGKIIAIVDQLLVSLNSLQAASEVRGEVIERFKANKDSSEQKVYMYFGAMDKEGITNQEYGGAVEGMYLYCDDVIYYSKALCERLHDYGEGLRNKLGKASRKVAPKIMQTDFKNAENLGLLPPLERYASWESGFITSEIPKFSVKVKLKRLLRLN